ncbi:MlaD family protein [Nocardioides sp.]|uniref:MlaD family protein n=1 Tax=Nocardioides sp. TaxID=35761 RepID=UPI0023A316A7|nr:MlaD family protein [Nocardioides sp.]MDE0776406.1 MlaD family protein [Nocardioides sp.]
MNESMRGARRFLAARKSSAVGIVGVVVLVMIATMATTSASDTGRSGESITLYAESADAGALIKGNDVRMYGVKIGVIGDLEVVRNDTAKMTLELTTAQTPIHTDATLRVRPVSLLGERYLELDPGSADAPRAEDGFTFPAEQVSRSVDLDEVLDTVDDPTGTALSALVQTLGDGIAGNGDNTAEAISAMGPSMKQANELVTLLSGQTATLQQLIDALDPVVAAVGTKDGGSVDSLIDSADRLLSATSGQEAALRATLEELPSTLVTAQKTLARLSGLADEATPALKSARPFTDDLDQIADEAIDFTDAASPAIATLKPVLAKGRDLVEQATPLVAQLNSSRQAMAADAANGSRFLNDLSDHLGGLLDFITFWSLTTNGKDGLSHYFRVQVIVDGDTVTSLIPPVLNDEPEAPLPGLPDLNLPDLLPDLNLPDLNLPDLGLSDLTSGLPSLGGLGGLLGREGQDNGAKKRNSRHQADDKRDSATGLTIKQESDLLNMLMGDAS